MALDCNPAARSWDCRLTVRLAIVSLSQSEPSVSAIEGRVKRFLWEFTHERHLIGEQ